MFYNKLLELAQKFKEMPPEEVAMKFGNRFAHKDGNIRSQIDELQRINLEKMKDVNGYASHTMGTIHVHYLYMYPGKEINDKLLIDGLMIYEEMRITGRDQLLKK